MPGPTHCPECGAALPANSPHGLCPGCLLLGGAKPPDLPAAAESTDRLSLPPGFEKEGDRIGRYKLLQKLGEGGCGIVYMAEQQEPVKRHVALKVIKLGMDTREVIARFEAERQALALMDHPNIAKVLDGGTTRTGRPFFVLELVRGIPITRYCNENRLTTTPRIELFILVCQAIQHAHQKGIIHRDIKPSNILVADHDGTPVPKVIDFGIAKATAGQTLTDKTLFTAFEQFIGTPAYMSPEQAKLSGLDIDTRSDIYSLGVLLYELLTGKTPFDPGRLMKSGLEEICRIIREEEPPRPSTRLSALDAAEQTTVARQRQVEPPRLLHLVRVDLDWIVMKCLEKDRTRRYATANGLAADLQRHLNSEPISARPPTPWYRFQKLFARNKALFLAIGATMLSLMLGLASSIWLFFRERDAHARAMAAQRNENRMWKEGEIRRLDQVASTHYSQNKFAEAEEYIRQALTLRTNVFGLEHTNVASGFSDLGQVLYQQRKFEEAESACRQSLAIQKRILGDKDLQVAEQANNLAMIKRDLHKLAEAEALCQDALSAYKALGQEQGPPAKACYRNLAFIVAFQSRVPEADDVFAKGEFFSPGENRTRNNGLEGHLAEFHARAGRWKEAARDFTRIVERDPNYGFHRVRLAALLVQAGDLDGYRNAVRQIIATFKDAEWACKGCVLVAPEPEQLQAIERFASGMDLSTNNPYLGWALAVKAMLEYRHGRFASAIEFAQGALREDKPEMKCQALAAIAMANFRLQRHGEAKAALTEATTIDRKKLPQSEREDLGWDWQDIVIARILLREARALIGEGATATNPSQADR